MLAEKREAADRGKAPPLGVEAKQEVNINELSGYELTIFAVDHKIKQIYFTHDSQMFYLRFPTPDNPSDLKAEEHYQTYIQMLSTFQFLD